MCSCVYLYLCVCVFPAVKKSKTRSLKIQGEFSCETLETMKAYLFVIFFEPGSHIVTQADLELTVVAQDGQELTVVAQDGRKLSFPPLASAGRANTLPITRLFRKCHSCHFSLPVFKTRKEYGA